MSLRAEGSPHTFLGEGRPDDLPGQVFHGISSFGDMQLLQKTWTPECHHVVSMAIFFVTRFRSSARNAQ